jgi:acyl carrier protein
MKRDRHIQNEIDVLLRNLHIEASSHHQDLIESGLLDSLKLVELLVELEQRFEMKIPIDDLELDNFRSIDRISIFVARHQDLPTISAPSTWDLVNPAAG